jgi:signal transduction histidine kinase
MSQLFSNLISNSLKYKRVNVTPKITITAELLPKGTAPKLDREKEYYRIEFMDNGIGFHQDYAEKIFDIFQRLHGKSEYSGTGIGLSICKKIIQNHHGHIEVMASEDIGALFVIMLPVTQNPVQD